MEEQKMIETELSTYANEFLIPHCNNITRFLKFQGVMGFFVHLVKEHRKYLT